jgi:glycosyltransferase involved in cell wall biosynthesis
LKCNSKWSIVFQRGTEIHTAQYIIVSPVRNEEDNIEKTIRSVISQKVKPQAWVIVNDGSQDSTEKITKKYLHGHPWIRLVNVADRGYRKTGPGVVEAFTIGFRTIENLHFDFITKLDGDISFEPDYFDRLLKKFGENPKLGIAGGWVYDAINGKLKAHKYPHDHVRGAVKTYRKRCFEEIGGLIPELGWDGIDEMSAQMLGWETQSFKELPVLLHKPMGSTGGILKGRLRGAYGACKLGYHPLFMLGRCLRKMVIDRPFFSGGLVMLMGFIHFKIKGVKPLDNPELIKFIRDKQKRRMTFWKRV